MLEILEVYMKETVGRKRKFAKIKCVCGEIFESRYDSIMDGKTKSCGCLKEKQNKENLVKNHKHKLSGTKLWSTFYGMKSRCNNPKDKRYSSYGGRGITICNEWTKFESFVEWSLKNGFSEMGHRTIDRINNDGNYEPSNCRWTDFKTQSRNRSSNILVKYEGDTITIKELSEKTGLNYDALIRKAKRRRIENNRLIEYKDLISDKRKK